MISFPNAKINLGLKVLNKREDGYHNLETIFYPIPFCDILELIRFENDFQFDIFMKQYDVSKSISSFKLNDSLVVNFYMTGNGIEGKPSDNLCIEAFRIFNKVIPITGKYFMHLHKKIPSGAGLGGGSADGTFALKMLNDVCSAGATSDQLTAMASELGSDCAVFVNNEPCFGQGRGEVIEPEKVNLKGYHLLVIKPALHVKTSDAFGDIKLSVDYRPGSIKEIVKNNPELWNGQLVNDFESTVLLKYPLITKLKAYLTDSGAVYVSMTGSGSAIYGLFKNKLSVQLPFENCVIFQSEL